MSDNGQVFGPPRERDAQIDALEAAWLETKEKYQAGKLKPEAYRAAKAEFSAARTAWRIKADKERLG